MNVQIKKILRTGLKLFQDTRGFQLIFHRVSKPIHLARIGCSSWVRAARIINESEKVTERSQPFKVLITRASTVQYGCVVFFYIYH